MGHGTHRVCVGVLVICVLVFTVFLYSFIYIYIFILFMLLFNFVSYVFVNGFGGLEVACWPLVPKFAGSNPAEAIGFLRAKKSSGGRSFNIISVALQLLWVMEHIVYVWVFW